MVPLTRLLLCGRVLASCDLHTTRLHTFRLQLSKSQTSQGSNGVQ